MEPVVGIDLGTTFSAVAWVDPATSRAEILRDPDTQEAILPSVVMFDAPGLVSVGQLAKDNAIAQPAKVVEYVKRSIGLPKSEAGFVFSAFGHDYGAQEVSAFILKHLRETATVRLGSPVTRAVITVPAYFDDAQRAATREAGLIAGFTDILDILDEPVAAALAYGLQDLSRDQTVFVFDLGGGTFDVTILRVEAGHVRELGTDGDPRLGGKDWDDRIIQHCASAFAREFKADPLEDKGSDALGAYQELQQRSLAAKIALSRHPSATIAVNHAGHKKLVTLTRAEFETMTQDLVASCHDLSQQVLADAQLTWPQIDTVLLVGGATRMPMIRSMVVAMTAHEPVSTLNPDECVAQGAAWQAFIKAVKASPEAAIEVRKMNPTLEKLAQEVSVSRVLSHPLGAVVHQTNDPQSPLVSFLMLKKWAPLPARHTHIFSTMLPNQTVVPLPITQDGYYPDGTTSARSDCKELGDLNIGPLPPNSPAGTPIEVTYEFAEDGILHVRATAQGGVDVKADIPHPGGLSEAELGLALAHTQATSVTS